MLVAPLDDGTGSAIKEIMISSDQEVFSKQMVPELVAEFDHSQ